MANMLWLPKLLPYLKVNIFVTYLNYSTHRMRGIKVSERVALSTALLLEDIENEAIAV